ncbi:MAG TPA: DUF1761 domain-containing protein [Candidatus Poseidoniales archaeon]|nr:MAG: hypothetical protein CXT71_01605 [Euryarchaeota archaeon]HIF45848.1 DUF1761 domain-containing protein [Candidatus Poseidoniales archaeon]HIL64566.1 DUF1761 domain-containing protein [Candidatus Poseidoniales archaeon]
MISMDLAWLPVGIGVVIWIMMGMIWYNPKVLGTIWMEHTGLSMEVIEAKIESGETNMGLAIGGSVVSGLVTNMVLGMLIIASSISPIMLALMCSLGFVMTDIGMYGFEGRTWKLYLIDKGWMVIAILISGILHTYL